MKSFVKKILFCFVIIAGIIATAVFKTPIHIQTDLMSLVNTNENSQQWPTDKISDKFSSVINIVIESRDEKIALKNANQIINQLNSEQFNTLTVQLNNFSLKNTTKDLIPFKNGLVSETRRELLQQNKTKQIANEAIKQISESMMPPLISLREDPFLLLSDYLMNLNTSNKSWTMHNNLLWQYKNFKHYFMIPVDVDTKDSNATTKQINLLYKQLSTQNTENLHIYISGIPLHTAIMVQKSQSQIGVLSFIAAMMAILFSYLLFRKMFTLLTVIVSLSVGFLCGATALFLCFKAPHILTFVFGTTLIGLGIDYSFHFLTGATLKDKKQIYKNMFHSFLTTLVCFLPLLFSGVSLLQQISVFTIVGLTTIYTGLFLFGPQKINFKIKPVKTNLNLPRKTKSVIFALFGVIIVATLPFVKTENNMNQLYRPDAQIAANETIVQKLNNVQQSAVLMIRGKTIQQVLETEESIKSNDTDFFSLSSIVPSIKKQHENHELVKNLYKKESKYLKQKLELKKLPVFEPSLYLIPENIQSPFLNNWINKLIIQDSDYVYSLAQVSPDTRINNANARIISVSESLTQQIEKYSLKTYRLLAICAICLLALLTVFYKKRAIIYLMPSVLAILLSICILTWFGQPITFFHMLSFFIVIGLGLDYTIFNLNTNTNEEMRPILFSFLTSFIGFGLLAFTSFLLIKSMGITLGLGLGLSYLISLFLFRPDKTN